MMVALAVLLGPVVLALAAAMLVDALAGPEARSPSLRLRIFTVLAMAWTYYWMILFGVSILGGVVMVARYLLTGKKWGD